MANLLINIFYRYKRFIKFLLVGGLNTAFGYLVFALLIWLGLHYSLATFLSTVIGIVFNFFTTGRLVFQNSDNGLIFRFFTVYGVYWVINVSAIWLVTLTGYTNLYVIGIALVLPCAMVSYVLMKVFVFGNKNKKSGKSTNQLDSVVSSEEN